MCRSACSHQSTARHKPVNNGDINCGCNSRYIRAVCDIFKNAIYCLSAMCSLLLNYCLEYWQSFPITVVLRVLERSSEIFFLWGRSFL